MDTDLIIGEEDIFPYIIRGVGKNDKEVRKKTIHFLNMIPHNIFGGQWYVIYEVIREGAIGNRFWNVQQANSILKNACSKFINEKQIDLKSIIDHDFDETSALDELYAVSTNTWLEMSATELDEADYAGNLQIYIETWAATQYRELHLTAYKITQQSLTEGRDTYYGVQDSKRYFAKESARIDAVLDATTRTSSRILVSEAGYEAFNNEKNNSPISHVVTNFGIKSIDNKVLGIRKSDVVVVMAFTGHGKTRMVSGLVYEGHINGQNGVYYCLESESHEYMAKLTARHLAEKYGNPPITDTDIIRGTYSSPEYEALVALAENDLFNNDDYGTIEFIPGPLYGEDFAAGLETFWHEHGRLDYVVIDHTSLVQSRIYQNKRELLDWFYPQLKILSGSFMGQGLAIICAHQLNRETYSRIANSNEGEEVNTDQGAADCIEVIRSASLVVTLYCEQVHKDNDLTEVLCTKMRNGQGFRRTKVYAQMGNCLYRDLPSTLDEGVYTL